jgi:peptidoglycan/LPS O-acetylase OafA/YrhL
LDNSSVSPVTSYRPDIDGLRSIAVLGVVFFHVGIGQFAGGYVGVDIFLVISGYLISGILFAEYDRTGSIALRDFYFRRLKRITPALIATIAVSTVFAVWLYSPALLREYGESTWMAALSISNIGFYLSSGYFDTDAHVKPLLHTWSLSVEEQFYAVWPLLILLVSRVPRWRYVSIGIVALISLVAAEVYLSYDRDAVFYLVPFRMFEFALGALVHAFPNSIRPTLRWLNEGIAAISLFVMVCCMFVFDENTPFPGVIAIIPCLAAALFIWTTHTTTARVLVGNSFMVVIGRASYALYLVHWPVIVFYERIRTMQFFQFNERSPWDNVAILAISISAAILLHLLVELPLRAPSVHRRTLVVGTLAGLVVCVFIGGVLVYSDGWVRRPWIVGTQYEAAAYQNWLGKRQTLLKTSCIVSPNQPCTPDNTDSIHGIVIGNSHVVDGMTIIRTIHPTHALTMVSTNGCGNLQGTIKNTRSCPDPTNLRNSPEYLRQFDYVVLSNRFVESIGPKVIEYLDFLHQNGIKKVVILSNYMNSTVAFDDVVQMYGNNPLTLQRFIYFPDQAHASVQEVALRHGYLFVDTRALVCGNAACPMTTPDDVPFSYDEHHLTYEYAVYMAGFLAPEITAYVEKR